MSKRIGKKTWKKFKQLMGIGQSSSSEHENDPTSRPQTAGVTATNAQGTNQEGQR